MLRNRAQKWWSWRCRDVAALAVVALFSAACFGPYLCRGQFLIGGDVFFYTHPLRTVAWEMIRSGALPLWTPRVLSGYPLLAMAQLGLGYPLTWTHLFLPDHVAEQIYVLAPFLLAPAFTYAYAREIERSRVAALLAALSFGYGGLMTNTYGMNAIPTNALMWLPLVLTALERARKHHFIPCLIVATLACSFSILTGHGQSFLQVGTLALCYALFHAIVVEPPVSVRTSLDTLKKQNKWAPRLIASPRWRPLLVAVGSMALASGVAAFAILETMRAARRSIRSTLTYESFSAGGFTPAEALRSFVAPLYHYTEVTTFQTPLVLLLAAAAITLAIRRRSERDPRVFFWMVVALCAWVLLLGGNTPFYRLLYHVPVFNLFRRPSRYSFEWTFAVSILGAYGWDRLSEHAFRRAQQTRNARTNLTVSLSLIVVSGALAALWWNAVIHPGGTSVEANYLRWKLWFTLSATCAVVWGWRLPAPWRNGVTTSALLLICFAEPFILIGQWWPGTAKYAARFTTPALTTRWLQQFSPHEQRVYVRVNGAEEEASTQPRFDALDRTALFGLQNVAGYEPLILDRYSRALGNVDFDALNPRAYYTATNELFEPRSHVLDLLNTGFVVVWPDLAVAPEANLIEHEGIKFPARDLALEIKPGEIVSLRGAGGVGDSLVLITSLANSVALAQGATAARLRVNTTDGRVIEVQLRAGIDTAEWAHERADVRVGIKHGLAPIFDHQAGDATDSFTALRYQARLPLGENVAVDRIEIAQVAPPASLAVWKAIVYDASAGRATPLTKEPDVSQLDSTRWQPATEMGGVLVLKNKRALPRAWLVAAAEAVDGEEALQRIRGVAQRKFDPRHTALLEVRPDELPRLPGGEVASGSVARVISYEPNRLVIETYAPTATVLIASEIFYPGWEATVDGQRARIDVADFLLRGIALPAGQHRVEMRYTAPAARAGAIICALTLCLIAGLAAYERRIRHGYR